MQIVIDIDENVFTRLFDNVTEDYAIVNDDLFAIAKSIRKGIPLPKGHGKLIDADELFLDIQTDEQMRLGEHLAWVRERIEDAPTVIEADIPTMYYPQVEGITPTIIEADKEGEET